MLPLSTLYSLYKYRASKKHRSSNPWLPTHPSFLHQHEFVMRSHTFSSPTSEPSSPSFVRFRILFHAYHWIIYSRWGRVCQSLARCVQDRERRKPQMTTNKQNLYDSSNCRHQPQPPHRFKHQDSAKCIWFRSCIQYNEAKIRHYFMHLSRESEGGGEIMFPLVGVTMFQLSVKGEQLLFPSHTLCPTSPHTYLRLRRINKDTDVSGL